MTCTPNNINNTDIIVNGICPTFPVIINNDTKYNPINNPNPRNISPNEPKNFNGL